MGKKEDKITVRMAPKNKQVIANQKRGAANAWRDSKSDSARARLREKYKKDGWSAAEIKAIIAAAKSGPRASIRNEAAAKQNTGLRKTFSTNTPYTHSKTTRPRRTEVLQEQRIGGPKRKAKKK